MLKRHLIIGGTSTTQYPAEEQHAYCNMLREIKCYIESWLWEWRITFERTTVTENPNYERPAFILILVPWLQLADRLFTISTSRKYLRNSIFPARPHPCGDVLLAALNIYLSNSSYSFNPTFSTRLSYTIIKIQEISLIEVFDRWCFKINLTSPHIAFLIAHPNSPLSP